jgi:signal transduction histidine kinase
MRQMEKQDGMNGLERQRVEAVVETLATLRSEGQSVAEVAHDARNMVTALGLYCDLLEEPGVLARPFFHYGSELRLVAAASRRLVEKLVALDTRNMDTRNLDTRNLDTRSLDTRNLDTRETPDTVTQNGTARGLGRWPGANAATGLFERDRSERSMCWDVAPAEPIQDLAHELLANRNLLAALAGPSIALTAFADGGQKPVRLSGEDLTRVLVNLVKNAAEAMPSGGTIQLGLRERPLGADGPELLTLTIEDSGPGIPANAQERIFESGYTSHRKGSSPNGCWAGSHRGLGLSITRSIVEGAGGRIYAENLTGAGARFELELPVTSR